MLRGPKFLIKEIIISSFFFFHHFQIFHMYFLIQSKKVLKNGLPILLIFYIVC